MNTSVVAVVPHGVLHNLPFAALFDGKNYLVDRYTIVALPSASVLPFVSRNHKPAGDQMIALGFGEARGLPSLGYAEDEARTVASIYGAEPLIGAAATKAALRVDGGRNNIVHVAAHYQRNSRNPLFSRLVLAPSEAVGGVLELHEIFGLDLQKTRLVVLSVCQSQVGDYSRGDDVVALSRAFMYAGASMVIASLWSVDDEATQDLMISFYTHLRRGMDEAAALRAAQADTRVKYPNPYFWAGFVLTGYQVAAPIRSKYATQAQR
jgi:CHAT domain-containing protein